MTETDNPIVKEHLKLKDDQIIKRIEEIDDNERPFQKMFESRELKPVIIIGRYDKGSKKYVIGSWLDSMTSKVAFNTASVASLTLTCAAGHRYRVINAGAQNATQASTHTLSGVLGGNVIGQLGLTSSVTSYAYFFTGAGTAPTFGGVNPIWMEAGDTLTITSNTCNVGVDNMEHFILYEDYEV